MKKVVSSWALALMTFASLLMDGSPAYLVEVVADSNNAPASQPAGGYRS